MKWKRVDNICLIPIGETDLYLHLEPSANGYTIEIHKDGGPETLVTSMFLEDIDREITLDYAKSHALSFAVDWLLVQAEQVKRAINYSYPLIGVRYTQKDTNSIWRCVGVKKNAISLSGPGLCRGVVIVNEIEFNNSYKKFAHEDEGRNEG